ncbi:MAG: hypothetical protein H7Y38_02700 [Armatimonadetes bacterium]|nr:hypothetical protein [Armatimonadota bacterium]
MSNENEPKGRLGDFKFNTVGREDVAAEVLRPHVDPAIKTRNLILSLVAVATLAGILYYSFQKEGKKIFAPPAVNKPFERPEINVN